MKTITSDEVTPAILALFDLSRPTMPRAFNVLEGVTRGQILVEDSPHASWGVVQEATYGTLYIGGEMNASLLASIIQKFRQTGEVGLGCWLDDPLNKLIPSQPDYDGRTLYFTQRSSHNVIGYELPIGYQLVKRDEQLLLKSFDYASTLDSFGSIEKALQYTQGTMILHGGDVVCEAATGAPTHGRIEIGVTTAENFRRQGFATIACAQMINICEGQGYNTWWDCAKQNIPSTKLARKLGYRNEQEYRYVWWAKN